MDNLKRHLEQHSLDCIRLMQAQLENDECPSPALIAMLADADRALDVVLRHQSGYGQKPQC